MKLKNRYPLGTVVLVFLVVFPFMKLKGFETNFNNFWAWSQFLNDKTILGFYDAGIYAKLSPFYVWFLTLAGAVVKLFHFGADSKGAHWVLKLPVLLFHLWACYLFAARWKKFNDIKGNPHPYYNFLAFLFPLCPAILYNIAGFGQVNAVMSCFTLLFLIGLLDGRAWLVAISFVIMFSFNPTALLCLPFMVIWISLHWYKNMSPGKFLRGGVAGAASIAALYLPFGLMRFPNEIREITSSDGVRASFNAFNFFPAISANWAEISQPILGPLTPFMVFGLCLLAFLGFIAYLMFVRKSSGEWTKEQLFLLGTAFTFFGFLFFPGMHETDSLVIYPFFALIFMRSRALFISFILFSIASTLNQAMIVDHYFGLKTELSGPIYGACTLFYFVSFAFILHALFKSMRKPIANDLTDNTSFFWDNFFSGQKKSRRIGKAEWTLAGILLVLSFGVTFYDLGSTVIPTHGKPFNGEAVAKFAPGTKISSVWAYSFGGEGKLKAICANRVEKELALEGTAFYSWKEIELKNCEGPVTLVTKPTKAGELGELFFYGPQDSPVKPTEICEGQICVAASAHPWFDEYDLSVNKQDFHYGTYFDEIYYITSVKQLLNGDYPWENTHPLIGKVFMAWVVKFTNFSPFWWRFAGAFIGSLIPYVLFWMSRTLLANNALAFLVGLFGVFEWTRITLSRIATIDAMVCFFILIAYWMFFILAKELLSGDLEEKNWKAYVARFFALGVSLGAAISIKWNAVFTIASINVAVFGILIYLRWKKVTDADRFLGYAGCFIGFLSIMPLFIYWLSFQPFHFYLKSGYSLTAFFNDQKNMYDYHSNLVATHFFASPFWSWPAVQKPVWLSSDRILSVSDWYRSIVVIGNPAIWWMVFPVIFFLFHRKKLERELSLVLALFGFSAQFFAWIIASRIMFLYHFLPCIMLSYVLFAYLIGELWATKYKKVVVGWTAVTALLTVCYFPVLAGFPVNKEFVSTFLKWFPGWYF